MEERQKDRIGRNFPKSEAYRPKQMTLAELPEEAAGITNIDVKALKEVNADVLGWIELGELSFPILFLQGRTMKSIWIITGRRNLRSADRFPGVHQ